jgi:hypothetical protein
LIIKEEAKASSFLLKGENKMEISEISAVLDELRVKLNHFRRSL